MEGELVVQGERVVGVEDPVLELVPTSSREDWQEWMETVVELSPLQWRASEGGPSSR